MITKISSIQELSDLDRLETVLIAYDAGSSGEFLSMVLSHCFPRFFQGQFSWEESGRCHNQDPFGRELAGNSAVPDFIKLRAKINDCLLSSNQETRYLVSLHPRPETRARFVRDHLPSRPMIKIVCRDRLSKQFRKLACYYKLKSQDNDTTRNLDWDNEGEWLNYFMNPSIEIEWSDLFLHNRDREFNRIDAFMGYGGDQNKFMQFMDEYLERNRSIIDTLLVDQ